MTSEDLLRSKLEQYGNVNNPSKLISVFYNCKKIKTSVTDEEIEELFSNVKELYYFSDATDMNDYENIDYAPHRKGYLKNKVIKLNTDEEKYLFPLHVSYNYSLRYNEWNGVFIGDLSNVFIRNFYLKQEKNTPTINSTIKEALNDLEINDTNLNNQQKIVEKPLPKQSNHQRLTLAKNICKNIYNRDEWGDTDEEIQSKIYKYSSYFAEAVLNKLNNKTLKEECYQLLETESNKKCLIVNSKLLNKYAEWIYITYELNEKWNREKDRKEYYFIDEIYLSNIYDLANKDIDFAQVDIKSIAPIKFYNDKSELIFDAEINDFELELTSRNFRHIIEERRGRLPADLQNQSIMEVSYRIRNSIEYSIKMSKADYNYIIPCYSIERDKIQYMMPLFSSFDFDKRIESVLIINKISNKYMVNTVLKIEEAYEMARILNRPTASWFI